MLDPLYTAIAWVMKQWHALFSTFLDPAGGITWALAIVFLVVTIRVLLFRLFVKQVKSQRAMQEIQPEIQKLRKQYGSDKQGFSTAMMALQKERGVNPLAGCLPILPQVPVFISLFHVLRRIAPGKEGLYSWSTELTQQASIAKLFGAPISSSFNMNEPKKTDVLVAASASELNVRIVAMVLIVIMCATTFFTQKQIQKRSGPVEGQAATVQKMLLYGMPVSLFVSGFFFPIGVLLYWFTNNLWTLGQQFYILKAMPPPGSPAALAKAAADKPVVDPKSLAPKPGAKPVRAKPARPAAAAPDSTITSEDVLSEPADGTSGTAERPSGDGAFSGAAGATAAGSTPGGPQPGGAESRPSGPGARPRGGSAGAGPGSGSGRRSGSAPANRGKRKRR